MPLNPTDLFVVQRGGKLFSVDSSTLKQDYGSTAQVHVGPIPPPGTPVQGDLWWSTTEGNLFIWYGPDPGSSSQWVDASPAFVEIDYNEIANELFPLFQGQIVSKIIEGDNISISPTSGQGEVRISADIPDVDLSPYATIDYVNSENAKQDQTLTTFQNNVDLEFQRVDKDIADLEAKHNQELLDLQNKLNEEIRLINLSLGNIVEDVEDIKACVFSGVDHLDGGHDNSVGDFDDSIDGNLPHNNTVVGGDSNDFIFGCKVP